MELFGSPIAAGSKDSLHKTVSIITTTMEAANKPTFEEVMKVWRNTEDLIKPFLRRLAAHRLVTQGFEEVGTSDTNLELYHMFLEYGSFMDAYDANIYPDKPFIWEV